MLLGIGLLIVMILLIVVGILVEGDREDEPGHSPWG